MAANKRERVSSTHTPACDHCRARKIKCDRDHPVCWNCSQEGSLCSYSDAGKRVNHVKLLAQGIGRIEDRLINVEEIIEHLRNSTRGVESQFADLSTAPLAGCGASDNSSSALHLDNSGARPVVRHLIHNPVDSRDLYYGPSSLFTLCKEFGLFLDENQVSKERLLDGGENVPEQNSNIGQNPSSTNISRSGDSSDALNADLLYMYAAAMDDDSDESFEVAHTFALPPKQLLMMACSVFFQQSDVTVQMFSPATFYSNIHRIYDKVSSQEDDAWGICCNVIVLLVLGTQKAGSSHQSIAGFAFCRPFLTAVEYALCRTEAFMLPKLINVQTLALLSIAVQPYFQPYISDRLFGQACLLAKRMGLGLSSSNEGLPRDAIEERQKVFTGLYLRDKPISLYRGTNCLLPSFDCFIPVPSQVSSPEDFLLGARYHLARYLEDIYIRLYSSQSHQQTAPQRRKEIQFLSNSLLEWACMYGKSLDSYVLLDYCAARIAVLRLSSDPGARSETHLIAKISCWLLSPAAAGSQQFPLFNSDGTFTSSQLITTITQSEQSHAREESPEPPFRVCSLIEKFPLSAFFTLARSIISQDVVESAQEDLKLLQTVNQSFQEYYPRVHVKTLSRKSAYAMSSVLRIIQVMRPDLFSIIEASGDLPTQLYTQFENISSEEANSWSTTSSIPTNPSPQQWLEPPNSFMCDGIMSSEYILGNMDMSGHFDIPMPEVEGAMHFH